MRCNQSRTLSKLDWILFGAMAVFCFFVFQQGDIIHTGGSSFAYLNGHFLDFYDYNVEYVSVNNYLPSTYILFAVWNIPIRLLGWVKVPTLDIGRKVLFWYKLLPTLFFFGSGYLLYKILCSLRVGNTQAKAGAFIFLSTPIAFFSQFIFGQYDSFTLFFMLLGIYYWVKDDRIRFPLFFAIAITFKYTALLIFVPLLLLREKRYSRIILSCLLLISLPLLEIAIYYPSEAFRNGVFDFFAVGYITNTSIRATSFSISIVVVVWILLCGIAFLQDCNEEKQVYKWGIFLSSLVCFLIFGLSYWHPQWLLFMTPFLVLGLLFHEKADMFLLVDFLLMGAFTLLTVTNWSGINQNMIGLGIFRDIVAKKSGFPVQMRELLHAPDKIISFSVFSGGLLVSTLFKHPRYLLDHVSEKAMESVGLIRLRFLGGLATFIVPALVCFGILLAQPMVILSNTEMAAHLGLISEESDIRQYFSAPESTLFTMEIAVGTYKRENHGKLIVEVHDAETDRLLAETTADISQFVDNTYCSIDIPETDLDPSGQYYLRFRLERESNKDLLTIYRTADKTGSNTNYAVINGEAANYNLCVNLYGKER